MESPKIKLTPLRTQFLYKENTEVSKSLSPKI